MSHRFNSQLGEGNAPRQEYRRDIEERAEAFGWRSNQKVSSHPRFYLLHMFCPDVTPFLRQLGRHVNSPWESVHLFQESVRQKVKWTRGV